MKTKLFLFLTVIILGSCDFSKKQNAKVLLDEQVTINGYDISIFEYDSCEYLLSGVGNSQMMTHKGNCKYCKIRNKK